MIGVIAKPEYANFDNDVRKPGAAFLATCPKPSSGQFRKKNFWSRAARELHDAYSGVCAYTAMYLPEQESIDHYRPKTLFPHLAYEWSNFRLASGRVNGSKGNLDDIIDPFDVQDDWFFIDIPACLVRPNPALQSPLRKQIAGTINSLRLNQDDNYVQDRCNILMDYARGDVTMSFLKRRYPFLAKEVKRQGLAQQDLKGLFSM